ncbi:NCS2 family permease [Desulfurispirillum indicum]|uniref:Xanthine/uracil/vitamin C permease n=1 Tax=Desulfurispirillum indicum (strain ATCC BAA-1389 / DSM 22839 / S5) TaxID=653733 RepID=E6W4B9_DESIS|nr:NCS2 family permease [Desulfurispirillum indicum]ADU65893.1 Xanthine/uracil/vitamin C permease [Desulfurispirillum indicum S5]UCZ57828.1 NCS2 family permease [Desulfurispirillum indicum]
MLESMFRLSANKTNVRQELMAGVTTFVTMGYIIFVNPAMLSDAGMNFNAVLFATCVSAAIATILMGLYANYPFALAPGMGINAYFTYGVVLGMGYDWQTALGAVFISGVAFIILTLIKARELIMNAIPKGIKVGTVLGIGLFIAFIGLKNAGIIVKHPATMVTIGSITQPAVLVAIFGLLLIAVLVSRKIKGAILWGILASTLLAIMTGVSNAPTAVFGVPTLSDVSMTFFQMDIKAAITIGLLEIIFVFLFVDIFDSIGTMTGLSKQAGYLDANGKLPRADKALMADGVGTTVGACLGTSTVTAYIESASGIAEGGRTGLTAVVVGVLFLLALFFTPIIGAVPAVATAPALIIVGALMLQNVRDLDFDDMSEVIPAFLTMIMMPLTFSIATGLAFGFISYPIIKALSGKLRDVSFMVWILGALFVLRFIFLAE